MLRFSFFQSSDIEVSQFKNMISRIYDDMETVTSGEATEAEIKEYCIVALKAAMRVKKDMYMWCCANTLDGMPSDARVDFMYVPTYIISGIIMYAYVNYESVREFKPLEELIPKYLNGCMGRNFMGHGLEAEEGFNAAMMIFDKCNVKEFVEKYPEINPEFTREYLAANEYWHKKGAPAGKIYK